MLTFCIGPTQLSVTVPPSESVEMEKERSYDLAPEPILEDKALSNHSSAEEQHKCVQCGNFFGHMLSEIGEQEHCCEECIKEFKRSSETHSAIHSGEKKYNCAQCNKPFSQAGTLKRPLLTHIAPAFVVCSSSKKLQKNIQNIILHGIASHRHSHLTTVT